MDAALIHRARVVSHPVVSASSPGAVRNAQGEYEVSGPEPEDGPWFPARLMERGGAGLRTRRYPDASDARTERGYELLAGPLDDDGLPVVLLSGMMVETDCEILGSPTIELSGDGEKLNNGEDHIGWVAYAARPGDSG